jgi:hypothetical protein
LLGALAIYAPNQTALEEDGSARTALSQLNSIRDNPAPYHQINQIDGCIQKIDVVNPRLVSEKREEALKAIEANLAEVIKVLD